MTSNGCQGQTERNPGGKRTRRSRCAEQLPQLPVDEAPDAYKDFEKFFEALKWLDSPKKSRDFKRSSLSKDSH